MYYICNRNKYDYIMELTFSIGDLIALFVAVVPTIVYFVSVKTKVESLEERFDKFEHKLESIESKQYDQQSELTEIRSAVMAASKTAREILASRHSPWTLNELGKKIYADMKGEEFLQEHKDFFFAKIDKYNPQTAFDVEEAALTVCVLSTGDSRFNRIKNFVYNYPTQKDDAGNDKNVSLEDACVVLSMPLRDMYLAEHTEIVTE